MSDDFSKTYRQHAEEIIEIIDGVFNPHGIREVGVAVLVFDLGEGGRMNYMSNGNREDMIVALKELIQKMEEELS